jgi:uncharacterized peroxidase-related enzyme
MSYPVHTVETAPEESKPALAAAERAFGFLPNLLGIFAESPALLAAYLSLAEIFENRTGLTAAERQTVLLTASAENRCPYCVAAHSTVARVQGVPLEVVESLRTGVPVPDPRLEALSVFTRKLVDERGRVSEEDVAAFQRAGFTRNQLFDVFIGVGLETLANYANHVVGAPLDTAFDRFTWPG